MREGPTIEFKRQWVDGIKKTMVAFANTDGGTIYIGIDDDGAVVGVDDSDSCILKAMQAASNAIRPDITLCTQANIIECENKPVVEIIIQRGTSRPYYLVDKGIRPAGVHVRNGAMTTPATDSAILAMIKESANDVFDQERSILQDLTFADTEAFFIEEGISFGKQQQRSLGFIDSDGLYTNTALLFSDQCPHTIKAAVFEGDTKNIFKDRFEFTGSILKQFTETLAFLNRYNATRSVVGEDMRRKDSRAFPPDAVREALLNMIAHRDYSLPAPALISVFDDRLEFVNFGGLMPGMSADDLLLGVTLQRNPHVASILYRLKLVEAYGTGVPKIMSSYVDSESAPEFDMASNSFKTALPSLLGNKRAFQGVRVADQTPVDGKSKAVLDYLNEKGSIVRSEAEVLLGLSRSSVTNLLARMESQGLITKQGAGRNTFYTRVV